MTRPVHVVELVLQTAPHLTGGYDRANLLEAVAATGKVTGTSRNLYVAATRGLSQYDENRALAALVRHEGRQ